MRLVDLAVLWCSTPDWQARIQHKAGWTDHLCLDGPPRFPSSHASAKNCHNFDSRRGRLAEMPPNRTQKPPGNEPLPKICGQSRSIFGLRCPPATIFFHVQIFCSRLRRQYQIFLNEWIPLHLKKLNYLHTIPTTTPKKFRCSETTRHTNLHPHNMQLP